MFKSKGFYLVLVLACVISISNGARRKIMYAMCPPNFEKIGNSCFHMPSDKLSWLAAHFSCKDKRSKLAEPLKQDDRALRRFLMQTDKGGTLKWIGGVYNWEKQQWQWGQTGKNLTYNSFNNNINQKDTGSQILRYHCSAIDPDQKFRWSARFCTEKHNFICQHRMFIVNESNRHRIYAKWNTTYPNELANEIEVTPDKAHAMRGRKATRLQNHQLQKLSPSETHHHNFVEDVQQSGKVGMKHQKLIRKNKKHQTHIPEFLNDAAAVTLRTGDIGNPIVEYATNDLDFIQLNTPDPNNKTMMDNIKTKSTTESWGQKHLKPEMNNYVYNSNNVISTLNIQKKNENNVEKSYEEEEAKRMAEARELLLRQHREKEEKLRAAERKRKLDELLKRRKEAERRAQLERNQRNRNYEKPVQHTPREKPTNEQRKVDQERLNRLREENERARQEVQKQKQLREQRRREQEQRLRQEELDRIEEEEERRRQQKHEEYEMKLKEEARIEEERLAEEKRLRQIERNRQIEENRRRKMQEDLERKRNKIYEKFKNLTPEQQREFLERREQRLKNKNKQRNQETN